MCWMGFRSDGCIDVSRATTRSCATLLLLSIASAGADDGAAPGASNQLRLYGAGPLTIADFRGAVPQATRFFARTSTDVRYDFKYRYEVRGNVTTVTLTEINAFATLDRANSWNARPEDKALLAHEQGHFDIAQLCALKLQLELAKLLKDGAAPNASAASEREAAAALVQKLDELAQPLHASMRAADAEYDQATEHGRLASQQADARKKQLAALKAAKQAIDALKDN